MKYVARALIAVVVAAFASLYSMGCEVNRITEVVTQDTITIIINDTTLVSDTIQLPPDTITLVDTTFVYDTTLVTDTLIVVDTILDVDTLMIVKDSVIWEFDDVSVWDYEGGSSPGVENVLGTFTAPEHVPFGMVAALYVSLSGTNQSNESFAVGFDQGWIGPSCPVHPDNPALGEDWVVLGWTEFSGAKEFVLRHGSQFECYPLHNVSGANSVHSTAFMLWYWRVVP